MQHSSGILYVQSWILLSYKLENEPELSEQEYLSNIQAKLYTKKGGEKSNKPYTLFK